MLRNSLRYEEYTLRVLRDTELGTLSLFDCGDRDLNDFFQNDCIPHREQLMAETFVFTENNVTLALISFSNDSIRLSDTVRRRLLPACMSRYSAVPAVKIARFGVLCDHQRRGVGSLVIDFCKQLFVTDNRTGCRVLTVDAYNTESVLRFYRGKGFEFLSDKDVRKPTRIMWCDLKRIEIRG